MEKKRMHPEASTIQNNMNKKNTWGLETES